MHQLASFAHPFALPTTSLYLYKTVCIPASYYYSYWNLAIFSESCTSALLDDKVAHDILIRVMPSYSKVGPAFTQLFKHYGWTQAVLVGPDGATYCEFGANGIRDKFKENNITISEWITIPAKGELFTRDIDSILGRVRSRGRSEYHTFIIINIEFL